MKISKGLIFTILTFLILITAVSGYSTSVIDRVLPPKYPSDRFVKLRNGLTILVRSDNSTPVVSVNVLVKAGSIYEPPLSGLSHYLEHVVAGGSTKLFKENEAKKKIEKMGGAFNAFTSYNRTVYYIKTTAEHYQEALDLILSFVHENSLDPNEVEREKGVIMEEMRMGENNVERQLHYLFFETAYQKHPVRYPVIGRSDVLARQTREDLVRYYERRYTPNNMVVCVVGPVSSNDVISFVGERTATWEYRPVEEITFPEEPLPVTHRLVEKEISFAQQERAIIGFPTVTLSDSDSYPLDVLATILGEGTSSTLVKVLKEEKQLVSSISVHHWSPSFVRGQLIISLMPIPGKWSEILETLKNVFSSIGEEGVREEELEAAKRKITSRNIFERATSSGQAMSLLTSFDETGDPYFDEIYLEKIRAVTTEEIQRVAKKYIRWDLATISRIGPRITSLGKEEFPMAKELVKSSHHPVLKSLPNGLKVLIKPDHKLPIVSLELHGLGGQLLDSSDKPGLSNLTASLLTSGTENYSRDDIFRLIESRGGSILSGAGRNSYFVSIKVLSEDLVQAIDILSDIVTRSNFPQIELEKKRRENLLATERTRENWQQELFSIFHEHFFNKDHPYHFNILGTKEAISRITRADLFERYRQMVVPNRSVLAIFGDVNEEEIFKLVSDKFSSWKQISSPFPYPKEALFYPTKTSSIEVKTSKTAVGIMVGTGGIGIDDPRRAVLDVIDANISGIGYPSGRLHEALRGGNQNLVYVVHGFPFYGIKGGYFAILAQTSNENRSKVRGIIFQELKRTATTPMDRQEILTAKNIITTMEALSLEDIDAQAKDAALNEALGLGWNLREKLRQSLDRVTPESVMELARDLFSKTLTIETIPQDSEETRK
ncbi:MAG: insulinase family protein [Syntrophobacterales bacterium]|nr:insulinase family protein [Syntrophobacterales bacterium]